MAKKKNLNSKAVDIGAAWLVVVGFKSPSANRKTGPMLQSYILDKSSLRDTSAFGSGCASCPMVKSCYVGMDKFAVRRNLVENLSGERSSIEFVSQEQLVDALRGKALRFGTYGDPSFIPLEFVRELCGVLRTWTGYTHYWSNLLNTEYSQYFMASVECEETETQALALGWRVFRVLQKGAAPRPAGAEKLVYCPAADLSIPEHKRPQCINCGLCQGRAKGARSIMIEEH